MQQVRILAEHYLRQYCEATLRDDRQGVFNHWKFNVAAAAEFERETGLLTDSLQARLYQNLIDGHLVRVTTAQEWLTIDKRPP